MTRYLYRGPSMLLELLGQDETGEPVTVEHNLVPGRTYDDLPEDDPTVVGWRERGQVVEVTEGSDEVREGSDGELGVVRGPAMPIVVDPPGEDPPPPGEDPPPPGEDPPPPGEDPPPPPVSTIASIAIPAKDASRVRRPKPTE